jgi:trans-aconitate methyltransferase
MIDLNSSWDNQSVFAKQLELNLSELSSPNSYPPHWFDFINLAKTVSPTNILDVGCGCGAFFRICELHFPDSNYKGCDFSEHAIKLAKQQWGDFAFFKANLFDLSKESVNEYDLIHFGAILDVLPNGDEALDFIFSLNIQNFIIGRMKLTEKESFYNTYTAYNEIVTCEYFHNINNLESSLVKYNYSIKRLGDSFLLSKNA